MSRLRQNNSQNYATSVLINDEFENIVRYINAAEHGNKTIAELLDLIFDDSGVFDPYIQLRLDTSDGVQYRAGDYTDSEEGWITVIAIEDIRGNDGVNVGTFGEPIFESKFQYTATGGETELDLAHDTTTLFLVYVNGLLQVEGGSDDYTTDDTGGTGSLGSVTFNAALTLDDEVVIYLIESGGNVEINRTDYTTVGSQSNFGFVFDSTNALQVYLNGILQNEGGGEDYILDADNDLVIFNTPVPAANDVAIISSGPSDAVTITGLMTESQYTDQNGYIPYSILSVPDGSIPVAKVDTLVATLAETPSFESSATTPAPPTDFWLDTSSTPNQLKFYTGSQYLSANPSSQVPSFTVTDANKVLQVDSSGTVLQFGDVDLSSLIPKTQKAAANGVASLDTDARIPVAQLPTVVAYESLNYELATVANGSEKVHRYYRQSITIYAIALRCDSGSCDVQIEIDGVTTGPVYNVSTTPNELTLASAVDVDAVSSSKEIGLAITNNSSGTNLDVALSIQLKSQ